MEPSGRAFGAPEDKLREMRDSVSRGRSRISLRSSRLRVCDQSLLGGREAGSEKRARGMPSASPACPRKNPRTRLDKFRLTPMEDWVKGGPDRVLTDFGATLHDYIVKQQ